MKKISVNKQIIHIFTLLYLLFTKEVFFVINHILGKNYEGSETTSIYIIINTISFIYVLFLFVFDLLKTKRVNRSIAVVIILNILVTVFFFYNYIREVDNMDIITKRFIEFSMWSFPATLMAYLTIKNQYRYNSGVVLKVLYWFGIILTLPSVLIINQTLVLGQRASIGGDTYQSAGYILVLGMGMMLSKLTVGTKNKKHNIFKYIYILVVFIAILSTGSRGPAVAGIIMLIYFFIKTVNINKLVIYFFISIIVGMLINPLFDNPFFLKNISRTFAFIGENGINWSGTSGRDILYINAIKQFQHKPIIGHGFFGYISVFMNGRYPHNLFLEILLQGGILMLTMAIFILILLVYKIMKIKKHIEPIYFVLIYLCIYQCSLLMFSGTYITQGLFWYLVLYLMLTNTKSWSKIYDKTEKEEHIYLYKYDNVNEI